MAGPELIHEREIVLLIEAGRLAGYRYRGWEERGDHVGRWLTEGQRRRLRRRGRLGPELTRRCQQLLAIRTELAVAGMTNHARLAFYAHTCRSPDEEPGRT